MSDTVRRVYIALCFVVGVIALVANVATTDAMVGKWPRVYIALCIVVGVIAMVASTATYAMVGKRARVNIALCIVMGVIAVGAIAVVANAATTDAVAGKWARVATFAIFLFSMSTARQLWKGLSGGKDEPNQPSASSRTDLIVREGLDATKDEPHQGPAPQRDDCKDVRDISPAAKDSDQLGFGSRCVWPSP
jgi:nitrate/nitrite transporter NarK